MGRHGDQPLRPDAWHAGPSHRYPDPFAATHRDLVACTACAAGHAVGDEHSRASDPLALALAVTVALAEPHPGDLWGYPGYAAAVALPFAVALAVTVAEPESLAVALALAVTLPFAVALAVTVAEPESFAVALAFPVTVAGPQPLTISLVAAALRSERAGRAADHAR